MLTNQFKELIKLKVKEESIAILDQCRDLNKWKEDHCYISREFTEETKKARK